MSNSRGNSGSGCEAGEKVEKLRQACNDGGVGAKILGLNKHARSTHLNHRLLKSSPDVRIIINSALSSLRNSYCRDLVRSILALPSGYDTAWFFACEIPQLIVQDSLEPSQSSILLEEVHGWLREVATYWLDLERKGSRRKSRKVNPPSEVESLSTYSPASWIVHLTESVLDTLFDGKAVVSSCRQALNELVAAIVDLVQQLDDDDVLATILEAIVKRNVRASEFIQWLRLMHMMRMNLRDADVDQVHEALRGFMNTAQDLERVNDYLVISDAIFAFSELVDCRPLVKNDVKEWIWLLVCFMQHASSDLDLYGRVELRIFHELELLLQPSLVRWLQMVKELDVPSAFSVLINLMLLIVKAAEHYVVDPSQDFSSPHDTEVSGTLRWSDVILFLSSKFSGARQKEVSSALSDEWNGDFAYCGSGVFDSGGSTSPVLSELGCTVYRSLFHNNPSKECTNKETVIKRGRSWSSMVRAAFEMSTLHPSELAAAGIVFIVLFHELPPVNKVLVSCARRWITSTCAPPRLQLYMGRILVRLSDTSINDRLVANIEHLVPLLSGELDYNIFVEMAWVLHPLANAKQELVRVAESAFSFESVRLPSRGEARKRGLFSLCILALKLDMSEAWDLLSDLILGFKPGLSYELRCWLYPVVSSVVSRESSMAGQIERLSKLFRDRFFQFCYKAEETVSFDPELAFSLVDNGEQVQILQFEEFGGLLGVLISCAPVDYWVQPPFIVSLEGLFSTRGDGCAELPMDLHPTALAIFLSMGYVAGLDVTKNASQYALLDSIKTQEKKRLSGRFNSSVTSGVKIQVLDEVLRLIAICLSTQMDDREPYTIQTEMFDILKQVLQLRFNVRQVEQKMRSVLNLGTWTTLLKFLLWCFQKNVQRKEIEQSLVGLAALCESCSAVQSLNVAGSSASEAVRLLGKLWSCYCSTATELVARSLVTSLDEVLEKHGTARLCHENGLPSSLPEVRSPSDVDNTVRYMRSCVLGALENIVGLILKVDPRIPEDCPAAFLQQLGGILVSCCDDLYLGLTGDSGGLNRQIFQALSNIVAQCCNIVKAAIARTSGNILRGSVPSLLSVCETSEKRLSALLHKQIGEQSAFRSVVRLCVSVLPDLHRQLNWTINTVSKLGVDSSVVTSGTTSAGAVFRCCVRIVKENESSVAMEGKLWDDVFLADSSSDDSCDATTRQPLGHEGVYLENEKYWEIAFGSSLEAFEEVWAHYVDTKKRGCTGASNSWFKTTLTRLQETLSYLTLLFEQVDGSSNIKRVMLLPEAVKRRVCSLTGFIVKDLCRSLKTIRLMVTTGGNIEKEGLISAEAVQAVVRVLPWLSLSTCDLGECIREWAKAETGAISLDRLAHTGWFHKDSFASRRLPGICRHIDLLYTELYRVKRVEENVNCFPALGELLLTGQRILNPDGDGDSYIWFRDLVTDKMNCIDIVRLGLDSKQSLDRFRSLGKRKEQRVAMRARKLKQQKLHRSRHDTVDKWLHQDRELDENEPVEDDGFSDLEDFLVEG